MTPRIEKAIDIFLDAINNGTLAKGTCYACACGNLIANKMGIKPVIHSSVDDYWDDRSADNHGNHLWSKFIHNTSPTDVDYERHPGRRQIKDSGFSVVEFEEIEFAFERAARISFQEYSVYTKEAIRADQIKGLEAVVKVMLTFDDCKETAQEVFTKRAELIPV